MHVIAFSTRDWRPPYGWDGAVARSIPPRRMLPLALLALLAAAQLVVASTSAPLCGELEDFPCGP